MILRSVSITAGDKSRFPFNLQLIQNLEALNFDSQVTFFVGENGSGKSTMIEGLAAAANLPVVGSQNIDTDESLLEARRFAKNMKLVWSKNTHRGFFLRAEDFFGFIKYLSRLKNDFIKDRDDYDNRFTGYGRDLAVGMASGQINGILRRYGELNEVSHGEGFLRLFQERLVPDGLYLLDEPEAALSPTRQLSLISLIKEMVNKNCQFIIASHSPILMAFPKATIYSFGNDGIKKIPYEKVEHVNITKAFLESPESFINKL